MPFLNQVITFINDELKAGSLKNEKLQPALYHGLSTVHARVLTGSKDPKKLELLPAIITGAGKVTPITANDKYAIQIYHKLLTNVYSYEKRSFGDANDIKSSSELSLVVFSNSKLTGKTKDDLEPVVLFGLPQHLSPELLSSLKISKCLITPMGSNMDPVQVFRQEYPQSNYFLNEQMSMFLIRYKIEMQFSQACVDKCLCD